MDSEQARRLAHDPALPAATIAELLAVDDQWVRWMVARRRDLSPEHVRTLLDTGDAQAISPLLRRGQVGQDDLRGLAADPRLRGLLASVENLPPDLLTALARDPNPVLVSAVAEHQRLPGPLAEELSRHPDPQVLRGLARNISLDPKLLAGLEDDSVAYALAANPATPCEVVARLATNLSFTVRRAAAHRTDLPAETYVLLAADPERVVRRPVAANPAAPEQVLRSLAADPEMRNALLGNPSLPEDLREQLSPTT
ncbi:hypothetical protein ABZ345_08070 [Lentzea sp. NPDC005914]|uniref:variant leucine-rich repeat-containing protein n=1 Tax=Lentzea sp. NPDC005914 TaxID=3154572 RepID=UPI0033FAC1F3